MTLAGRCETGVLYCGDNLERLAQLSPECVDLIYLDLPFSPIGTMKLYGETKRKYALLRTVGKAG